MDRELLIRTSTSALISTKELDWLWWHVPPADIARIVIETVMPLVEADRDELVFALIAARNPGIDMEKVRKEAKK